MINSDEHLQCTFTISIPTWCDTSFFAKPLLMPPCSAVYCHVWHVCVVCTEYIAQDYVFFVGVFPFLCHAYWKYFTFCMYFHMNICHVVVMHLSKVIGLYINIYVCVCQLWWHRYSSSSLLFTYTYTHYNNNICEFIYHMIKIIK